MTENVFYIFCPSCFSCKLLQALFSWDAGGLAAETFQAPAAWYPQHLILIPQTKPSLFIIPDTVLLLCQTLAIEYEDRAPLCCLGKIGWRSELPMAAGHLHRPQSCPESLGCFVEWQKLNSSTAGVVLEHILSSCWYYPWVQCTGENTQVCFLTPFPRRVPRPPSTVMYSRGELPTASG